MARGRVLVWQKIRGPDIGGLRVANQPRPVLCLRRLPAPPPVERAIDTLPFFRSATRSIKLSRVVIHVILQIAIQRHLIFAGKGRTQLFHLFGRHTLERLCDVHVLANHFDFRHTDHG